MAGLHLTHDVPRTVGRLAVNDEDLVRDDLRVEFEELSESAANMLLLVPYRHDDRDQDLFARTGARLVWECFRHAAEFPCHDSPAVTAGSRNRSQTPPRENARRRGPSWP